MAVYVDNMRAPFQAGKYKMIMCHMLADSLAELHAMAARIGVDRRWFQCPPKASAPHYDICLSKKKKALTLGAIEITDRRVILEKFNKLREEFRGQQDRA